MTINFFLTIIYLLRKINLHNVLIKNNVFFFDNLEFGKLLAKKKKNIFKIFFFDAVTIKSFNDIRQKFRKIENISGQNKYSFKLVVVNNFDYLRNSFQQNLNNYITECDKTIKFFFIYRKIEKINISLISKCTILNFQTFYHKKILFGINKIFIRYKISSVFNENGHKKFEFEVKKSQLLIELKSQLDLKSYSNEINFILYEYFNLQNIFSIFSCKLSSKNIWKDNKFLDEYTGYLILRQPSNN
jgi:hypothetical protein